MQCHSRKASPGLWVGDGPHWGARGRPVAGTGGRMKGGRGGVTGAVCVCVSARVCVHVCADYS